MADAATSLRLRRGGSGGVHYSSGVTPLSSRQAGWVEWSHSLTVP